MFALISYIIGSNFMSVYGTSADTIIHCYCLDDDVNKGAQHAPEELKEFLTTKKVGVKSDAWLKLLFIHKSRVILILIIFIIGYSKYEILKIRWWYSLVLPITIFED